MNRVNEPEKSEGEVPRVETTVIGAVTRGEMLSRLSRAMSSLGTNEWDRALEFDDIVELQAILFPYGATKYGGWDNGGTTMHTNLMVMPPTPILIEHEFDLTF